MSWFTNLLGSPWANLNKRIYRDFIRGEKFFPLTGHAKYNNLNDEKEKVNAILTNPAALFIFTLNCDLFSLGEVIIKKNDEILEEHPLYDILEKPNPYQSQNQFLWDYMFWSMTGNANLYVDSKFDYDKNMLMFLNNSKIDYPQVMIDNADKYFKNTIQKLDKVNIDYIYDDGSRQKMPYNKILHFSDTTISTNAYYKGSSKLDALYKVISNSELALDAKNIELLFNGKYMVAGKVNADDINQPMMMPDEKANIERKVLQDKPITAVRSMVDIKKFIDSLKTKELDHSFLNDAYVIGRIYQIPKDVIQAFYENGAKYENAKLATADHVDYALQPKGKDFVRGLAKYFGFEDIEVYMDWSHLPFMQVRQMQKYDAELNRAKALKELLTSGVDAADASRLLDYEFKKPINYEQIRNTEITARGGQSEN